MITVDKFQGYTSDGGRFGYVAGDEGGWFFEYRETLDETLETLVVDTIDGDGGVDYTSAKAALRAAIAQEFASRLEK